jgi:hypothetical protein
MAGISQAFGQHMPPWVKPGLALALLSFKRVMALGADESILLADGSPFA